MISYHGTSSAIAARLVPGRIDVSLGGGELGRGFYSGQFLHEAKTWAFHKFRGTRGNVLQLDTPDDSVEILNLDILDTRTASLRRSAIRRTSQTRTFLFNRDLIWAPIVGSERVAGDQYKWEARPAQELLNGATTTRTIR